MNLVSNVPLTLLAVISSPPGRTGASVAVGEVITDASIQAGVAGTLVDIWKEKCVYACIIMFPV